MKNVLVIYFVGCIVL